MVDNCANFASLNIIPGLRVLADPDAAIAGERLRVGRDAGATTPEAMGGIARAAAPADRRDRGQGGRRGRRHGLVGTLIGV
jgi:hypothetical protein